MGQLIHSSFEGMLKSFVKLCIAKRTETIRCTLRNEEEVWTVFTVVSTVNISCTVHTVHGPFLRQMPIKGFIKRFY
jgi:hypothetical protein